MANSITAPYGLETNNPLPEIKRYYNLAEAPYVDTAQVLSQVALAVRYPGQTFNVNKVEYWFKDGVADLNLVVKTAAPPTASNVGTEGVGIFKELSNNDYKFKKLTSSDNSVIFTENPSEPNIINVTLTKVEVGALKTFYVNSQYPNTLLDADGSITRPFPTFDEARAEYMGTSTDITNPQYKGSKIILQTSASTAINPTINGLVLELQNNSILTYTGTDLYMFDTEILYPLIPKGSPRNNLTDKILLKIIGEGTINRTAGVGLVRGMGSNRNGVAIPGDLDSQIILNGRITLEERVQYPSETWTGNITTQAGATLESIYGTPHKYSLTLLPTTPLLYAEYQGYTSEGGVKTQGLITFKTLVNTAIKAKDVTLSGENFNFLVFGSYIATSSGTKMTTFPEFYQPQPNRNMIELDNASLFLTGKIRVDDIGGYRTTGVTNFFKITNDSIFTGGINIFSNYYMGTFLNVSDTSNTNSNFNISNNYDGSKIQTPGSYFIDTTLTPFSLNMPNSNVSGFTNKSTSSTVLDINTDGTLASFLGTPVISNIASYADNTEATTGGLVINSLYFNTTTGGLDIVN